MDSIFSTHVEMNQVKLFSISVKVDFLHACGDEPKTIFEDKDTEKFSPRMWRWTGLSPLYAPLRGIFSTHVEMNRLAKNYFLKGSHFLHACGDEPFYPD